MLVGFWRQYSATHKELLAVVTFYTTSDQLLSSCERKKAFAHSLDVCVVDVIIWMHFHN